ncbi:hypothetical protein GCM10023189_16450 [Nibrella saemangeumensis]|uniref:DUF4199 domain-containing protein n=1 Tax=Nibrella saemangeumensis TaxID=1084526 RepID=A0ABP8MLI0_9BACT
MEEKPSTARIALKWGLIIGIASILFSTVLYITEQVGNTALSLIAYVIIIVGLVMAMREYRSLNNDYMSYGEGLGIGALTAGVSGILSSLYGVLYTNVIDPEFQSRMEDQMRVLYEERGMSDDQIDKAMEFANMFQSPGLLFVFGVLGTIFMGFIFSLVIAAILRRNRPVFE